MKKATGILMTIFTSILLADDGWGGDEPTPADCTTGEIEVCSSQCGAGKKECIDGVWSRCSAQTPLEEICDGIDNDCDGSIDEGGVCSSCDSVDCGNGTCEMHEGQPFCNCTTGFHAERLSCLPNNPKEDGWGGNPCNDKNCGAFGTCENADGKAFCNCHAGYHVDVPSYKEANFGTCVANDAGYAQSYCPAITAGMNDGFMVDGEERRFLVHLPDNVQNGNDFAVIFNWHGLDDTAENIANYTILKYLVNDDSMPFILISPEDLEIEHPKGVEWHNINVPVESKEVRFFDKMLYCLREQYNVDENHIHSVGFSSGSILTDLIASSRSDVIASVATYSGTYCSNTANNVPGAYWPELVSETKYAQLMFHGGNDDNVLIPFNENTERDSEYLRKRGHDTIVCNHGLGHQIPWEEAGGWHVLRFFEAHPKGTEVSPYNSGLPSYFPAYCEFRGKINTF